MAVYHAEHFTLQLMGDLNGTGNLINGLPSDFVPYLVNL